MQADYNMISVQLLTLSTELRESNTEITQILDSLPETMPIRTVLNIGCHSWVFKYILETYIHRFQNLKTIKKTTIRTTVSECKTHG